MKKIELNFDKRVGMGGKLEIEYSIEVRDTITIESPVWYLLDQEIQEIIFNEIMSYENSKNGTEELYNLENDYREDYGYEKGDE